MLVSAHQLLNKVKYYCYLSPGVSMEYPFLCTGAHIQMWAFATKLHSTANKTKILQSIVEAKRIKHVKESGRLNPMTKFRNPTM